MQRIPLLLACFSALLGCADTRWTKAGADPATLEQDLEQCWRLVALRVPRPATMPRSMGTVTGSGGSVPIVINTEASQNADSLDRLQREDALLTQCMNGKGYARVSAGETSRK